MLCVLIRRASQSNNIDFVEKKNKVVLEMSTLNIGVCEEIRKKYRYPLT